MNENEIIHLARECGTYQNGDMVVMTNEGLFYFAKMIESAEREECSKFVSDLVLSRVPASEYPDRLKEREDIKRYITEMEMEKR